jgi:hypothetical protein
VFDPKRSMERVGDDDAWDSLVQRSSQGTIFSESQYLRLVGRKCHRWWVKHGTRIKAGVCLVVSDDGRRCDLDDLIIYGGILFDTDPKRPVVNQRYDEFRIVEYVAMHLADTYDSVDMALSPHFKDMRPFLWFGFNDNKMPKFVLDLRYTSYLDITDLREFEGHEEDSPVFARLEDQRRRNLRSAARDGATAVRTSDSRVLLSHYQSMMERQDDAQPADKLGAMRSLFDGLLEAGRGVIFQTLDARGTVLYTVMYAWDSKRAYYLFGAGQPDSKAAWQGTLANWAALKYLSQERNLREVDLEGVNSPQRGWFKLGFGGDLRPYYQIHRTSIAS